MRARKNIGYTEATAPVVMAATSAGSAKVHGDLAEVYIAYGQYLDFTVTSNRRKFISSTGKPVNLGTDGSLPTAVSPSVYFHLAHSEAPADFGLNRGSGGNFTVQGSLTTAATSPST